MLNKRKTGKSKSRRRNYSRAALLALSIIGCTNSIAQPVWRAGWANDEFLGSDNQFTNGIFLQKNPVGELVVRTQELVIGPAGTPDRLRYRIGAADYRQREQSRARIVPAAGFRLPRFSFVEHARTPC